MVSPVPDIDRRHLRAAQAGDERAFRELVELHRPALQSHCYRMLGSLQDSEDAFQDTMLRAWRSIESLEDDRMLKRWLYRIATNVCLTALRTADRRALPVDLGPSVTSGSHAAEPADDVRWIGPYPDHLIDEDAPDPARQFEAREAIELSFVAALQHLPARQRAALVLADVLGFRAAEIAGQLETTEAAVNSALQRARERIRERLPDRSQQVAARALSDPRLSEISASFIAAMESGDERAIVALLSEDVSFEMPPYRAWSRGREAVARSWLIPTATPPGLKLLPAPMNGQLGFGVYALSSDRTAYLPAVLDVVSLEGDRISRVVAFRTAEAFERFGLPPAIERSEVGN